jgi:hypothetical protein
VILFSVTTFGRMALSRTTLSTVECHGFYSSVETNFAQCNSVACRFDECRGAFFFKSIFFPELFLKKWFLKKSFDVSDATTNVDVDIDADVDDFVYFFVNSTRFFGNFWILFSVRFHSGKPSRIVGLTDAWTFVNWRF